LNTRISGTSTLTLVGPANVVSAYPFRGDLDFPQVPWNLISVPIAGSAGLNKLGEGSVTLAGTNSFTGGVRILGGVLHAGNANLGAPAGSLVIDGGALSMNSDIARNIAIGNGGGTLLVQEFTKSLTGVISGAGGLHIAGLGSVALTAANPYSGETSLHGGGWQRQLILSGNASILNSPTINLSGVFVLDNKAGAVNANRLGDSAAVNLSGGEVLLRGGATFANERTGSITLLRGVNQINDAGDSTLFKTNLSAPAIVRSNRAVLSLNSGEW
jgi:autotransporter-associated beta strand protein